MKPGILSPYCEKDISACGLTGIISRKGKMIKGEVIIQSITCMNERGNGLGGGFAAYGIYNDFKNHYALHIMYSDKKSISITEEYLRDTVKIEHQEVIPTRRVSAITNPPYFMRYFVSPPDEIHKNMEHESMELGEDNYMVKIVMHINSEIPAAFVVSSGKNMGAFKGVGFAHEIADFFMLEDYEGYIWIAHNRFPTNTPGWWGGAHPFTLLDWSIVHNGEISSYGINKRYLEMFGYKCTLLTDTEVITYMLDLLIRRHRLPLRLACSVLAAPFWKNIERMEDDEKKTMTALRMVYGSALLNGPFAILFAHKRGLVGLSDRVKLRPLVAGEKDDMVYMASEESAITEICPNPDRIFRPDAGEPVIAELEV
ncbi:MAG: glutamine amidotransferase family protein [Nitrospinota bacterium]|jgi:glutamate synthase domain-containing protein 1